MILDNSNKASNHVLVHAKVHYHLEIIVLFLVQDTLLSQYITLHPGV